MFCIMSANEVREQVKLLSPRKRRKFFRGVHNLEAAFEREPGARRRVRYPNAAARRRRIAGVKLLPKLVLLARDEERY